MVQRVARNSRPVRLSLTSDLDDDLSGAWWQRTEWVADELPWLTAALQDRLGPIVDIEVNWSSCDGVPDLDLLTRRGVSAMPGVQGRPQRVISVIGGATRANLLVVPHRTTTAVAVMVLRHAAGLPIDPRHQESAAYRAADDVVRAGRAQCARWRNGV